MSKVRWSDPEHADSVRQLYPIVRPKPNQTLVCEIWMDEPIGTHVHFYEGRTQPCRMPETCPGCNANLDRRYEAYLWIRDAEGQQVKILVLPYLAAYRIWEWLKQGNSLYARIAIFTRKGKTKRSQVGVSIRSKLPEPLTPPNLPPLGPMLERIWGCRGIVPYEESGVGAQDS